MDPETRTETSVAQTSETATFSPTASIKLDVSCFGLSDRGRVRAGNEDQFLIAKLIKGMEVLQTSLDQPDKLQSSDHSYLLIVADGMGGAQAGEYASALAIDSVETFVLETIQWFVQGESQNDDQLLSEFRSELIQAHSRVRLAASRSAVLQGMGTTLTLAHSLNDELFLAHVGDSRCYLFRASNLYRLTQDHTLVEEMVRNGFLRADEIANHRWRHVITSVVGGDDPSIRIDVHKLHLQENDLILLCSDGLTEMLSQPEIAELLQQSQDPAALCRLLIDEANAAGGRDNITVVVTRYSLQSLN